MRNLIGVLSLITLSGCSWMFPYENEFGCPRKDFMGKCVNSMQAYEEITTGNSKAPYAQPASLRDDDTDSARDDSESDEKNEEATPHAQSGYMNYVQSNYEQQRKLLEKPVTPLLKSPTVLEILVMSRRSEDGNSLYGNRYMHVIVEDAEFIFGDYMKKKTIPVEDLF